MGERSEPTVMRRESWRRGEPVEGLTEREWLVTNGLGGFASMTIALIPARRYHGLLVAALAAPVGRAVMLSRLDEDLVVAGEALRLGGVIDAGVAAPSSAVETVGFRLEMGLPVWTLRLDRAVVERRVLMPHRQNTVHVGYRLLEAGAPVLLRLRPLVQCRRLEDQVSAPLRAPSAHTPAPDRCEVIPSDELPHVHLWCPGARFSGAESGTEQQWFAMEAARGYDAVGELWSPGSFGAVLETGAEVTLTASTEEWPLCAVPAPGAAGHAEIRRRRVLVARAAPGLRRGSAAELVLAADQFLVTPAGRLEDVARAHAEGDEVSTVIAGYHWFTDWGRDTMISLEGLTLATGRTREAAAILRNFARHVRGGLVPNLFPEGRTAGLYNTADASLWFFQALHRYVETSGDRGTLGELLPVLRDIVSAHLRGTDFNIGVDPADGLLTQGAPGCQLTWMDAKVGDWVVTPRRGKAVELQGLWYNALRLLESWVREEGDDRGATALAVHAQRARDAFNRRFWCATERHLYDVVDGEGGDDASCRPNQVLTFSLEHPVLDEGLWAPVLEVVTERLLTPVGLRSLAPGSPGYQPRYDGDLRARDAAYHQGTVWAWLIGPYVDAWRRVQGERASTAPLLGGLLARLDDACIGQLSEIYDAQPPFRARGCVAQAWSVAEVLRCMAVAGSE